MQLGGLELARQLARFGKITGQQPQLELAQDLVPVVNAFNLDEPPFHSKRGGIFGINQAGAAGAWATAAIGLPVGDKRVIVIRYIDYWGTGGDTLRMGWGLTSSAQVQSLGDSDHPDWDSGIDPSRPGVQEWTMKQGSTVSDFAFNSMILFGASNARERVSGPIVIRSPWSWIVRRDLVNAGLVLAGYYDVYE